MSQPASELDLSKIVSLEQWREQRGHLFPSDQSLRWFMRRHKADLVDGGGLLVLRGAWCVNPSAFDAIVVAIMQREARELVGNGSGPVIA